MDPLIALIFDDDGDFARALANVLQEAGFAVVWAMSVEEARRLIEAHPIAVLLVHLHGEERGRHLLDDLAGMEHAPPTMIVAAQEDARAISAEFGVPCVGKPFERDKLLAAIEVTRAFPVRPLRRAETGPRSPVSWSQLAGVVEAEAANPSAADGAEDTKQLREQLDRLVGEVERVKARVEQRSRNTRRMLRPTPDERTGPATVREIAAVRVAPPATAPAADATKKREESGRYSFVAPTSPRTRKR